MSDVDLKVPRNREAEEAVIGAAIQSPGAFAQAARFVLPDDFYYPAHELIWRACMTIADAGRTIEPMLVMTEMKQAKTLEKAGGSAYLATLMGTPWLSINVDYQARLVHESARARGLLQIQQRMGQILNDQADDQDMMLTNLARQSLAMELLIDERSVDAPLDGLMHWSALWNIYPHDTVDWIIDDFLMAEDVLMLLGGEGGGKSWFSRQFCLCLAAGIHPFRYNRRIRPVRSLLVDLENAPAMVAFESRKISGQINRLGEFNDELASVWMKEDGIDLRDRAQAMLLERAIAETNPQVVAIGSLYKAFKKGRDDWETAAEETREVLDRIRRRHRCAFIIEHHMPKATSGTSDRPQSPYGSSTWQKWPSIGLILNRVGDNMYQLKEFRGTRMERQIPLALTRGGELPWTPVWDNTEMEYGMWEELRPKPNRRRP